VLLAEAKNKVRRGPQALKEIGEHPEDGNMVRVMDGRYGPYVKHNAVNATIPRGTDPEDVDMEMAMALIAARIAKGPAKKKAKPKKKKAAKKKKTAAKSKAKSKAKPKAKKADE
jgi:DNA topoisomerase-1